MDALLVSIQINVANANKDTLCNMLLGICLIIHILSVFLELHKVKIFLKNKKLIVLNLDG